MANVPDVLPTAKLASLAPASLAKYAAARHPLQTVVFVFSLLGSGTDMMQQQQAQHDVIRDAARAAAVSLPIRVANASMDLGDATLYSPACATVGCVLVVHSTTGRAPNVHARWPLYTPDTNSESPESWATLEAFLFARAMPPLVPYGTTNMQFDAQLQHLTSKVTVAHAILFHNLGGKKVVGAEEAQREQALARYALGAAGNASFVLAKVATFLSMDVYDCSETLLKRLDIVPSMKGSVPALVVVKGSLAEAANADAPKPLKRNQYLTNLVESDQRGEVPEGLVKEIVNTVRSFLENKVYEGKRRKRRPPAPPGTFFAPQKAVREQKAKERDEAAAQRLKTEL